MEALLADKVHKQRAFHTTIPTLAVTCMLGGINYTYVGTCMLDGINYTYVGIWLYVVECALLVCVLCQPVPPYIQPSLHLVDFS